MWITNGTPSVTNTNMIMWKHVPKQAWPWWQQKDNWLYVNVNANVCHRQDHGAQFSIHWAVAMHGPLHFLCKSSNVPGPVSSVLGTSAGDVAESAGLACAVIPGAGAVGGGGASGGLGTPGPAAITFPMVEYSPVLISAWLTKPKVAKPLQRWPK